MTNSKNLAGFIGPVLIVVCLSEAMNLDVFKDVTASLVYLNGSLLFIAGFAIVRAHNRWVMDWTLAVTLVGWFVMIGGLTRMFATELAMKEAHNKPTAMGFIVVLLAVGVFLTYKAYGPDQSRKR
ncbi:MAG: hypothetical protein OEV94_04525 [Deltaproteobacteria bacterium]|nr:hypothetical protein [Deltaproteobacteria bacterium]